MPRKAVFISMVAMILTGGASAAELGPTKVSFVFQDVSGIGREEGVCRRDPSDVIRVGDTCYVWYTKVTAALADGGRRPLYPSGYPGTVWYATSRDDGHTWKEGGESVGLGEAPAFDSHGVFTPNILVFEGKYYLYYTAVADRPEGPYRRLNDGDAVQDSGHEVLVWPEGGGVMSLVGPVGQNGRTLQYAEDGVHFKVIGKLPKYPSPAFVGSDL